MGKATLGKRNCALVATLGLSTALALGSPATAAIDLPDGFNIIVTVGDDITWQLINDPEGTTWIPDKDGFGGELYGESDGEGWEAAWNLDDGGTGFADGSTSVFGNFSFTNTTGQTQTFSVTVMSPLNEPLPGQTEIFGSISATVLDSGGDPGATLAAPTSGQVYNALVDGNSVRTLMDDPFTLDAPPDGTNDGTESFSNEPGPFGAFTSVAIEHTFTLTAGDSATISSAFTIVPAPSALALLGLVGLFSGRRRRD